MFLVAAVALAACHHAKNEPPKQHIAITNATIYPAPGVAPIRHGVIVIRGEDIATIGADNDIKVPDDAAIIDADGQFVVAGFWLTGADLTRFVANVPQAELQTAITNTFSKRGYTTVIDSSSDSDAAVDLRERIAAHELEGPMILTAKEVAGIASTPPATDPESSFDAKLTSLTTGPANRYGDAKAKAENRESEMNERRRDVAHSGKLTEGARADIVLLGSDPAHDLAAFTDVRATLSRGRVCYSSER